MLQSYIFAFEAVLWNRHKFGFSSLCITMSQRPLRSRQPVPGGGGAERISLMISAEDRASLDNIADEKRVSLAWVVRDAVARYLALPENQVGNHEPHANQ